MKLELKHVGTPDPSPLPKKPKFKALHLAGTQKKNEKREEKPKRTKNPLKDEINMPKETLDVTNVIQGKKIPNLI